MMSLTGSMTDNWELDSLNNILVEFMLAQQLLQYLSVSIFVVVLFEYLITFYREVDYAWGHGLTFARILFFLNRYISLFQLFISVVQVTARPTFFVSCIFLQRVLMICSVFLHGVWAMFSGLRIYAITGRGKRFIATMVVLLTLTPLVTSFVFFASIYLEVTIPFTPASSAPICDGTVTLNTAETLRLVSPYHALCYCSTHAFIALL
ncbi:hypothetical protein C8Q80DRAFT_721039 [Daedaleopsis nitida]|nr:hypothetical protein C8Q80DRAFT_721039 [Daedaleopsis nitida]